MKGQLSVEAVYTVAAIMIVFSLFLLAAGALEYEASGMLEDTVRSGECERLADSINAVCNSMDSSWMLHYSNANISVRPGLISVCEGGQWVCVFDHECVNQSLELAGGEIKLVKRGGFVEFM
jgi:hypothetical protein